MENKEKRINFWFKKKKNYNITSHIVIVSLWIQCKRAEDDEDGLKNLLYMFWSECATNLMYINHTTTLSHSQTKTEYIISFLIITIRYVWWIFLHTYSLTYNRRGKEKLVANWMRLRDNWNSTQILICFLLFLLIIIIIYQRESCLMWVVGLCVVLHPLNLCSMYTVYRVKCTEYNVNIISNGIYIDRSTWNLNVFEGR